MPIAQSARIHPSAIVAPEADLADDVQVGPFAVIEGAVRLGPGCVLRPGVHLIGPLTMGCHNTVYSHAVLGEEPQHAKYRGEPTRLEIGDHNVIREHVTIHRGTTASWVTRVGSHNFLMANSHIGHDSQVGDHCILANAATLAGHVVIEDHVTLGAFCPVHQHCTVGAYAFVGGGTIVTQDVLPFSLTSTRRENKAFGINKIGLERRGFSPDRLARLQKAFRLLLAAKLNTTQAMEKLRGLQPDESGDDIALLIRFIERSQRGVIK
jgi:UDP-N-acetylglucosamine acyltransferase